MITMQKVLLLRRVDLFAEMTTRQLGHVASVTQEQMQSAGSMIFEEGDAGDALYLIVSGNVEALPFPDDSFDVVMSFGLIEHFEDIDGRSAVITETA